MLPQITTLLLTLLLASPLFAMGADTSAAPVIALVFHKDHCHRSLPAIENYLSKVENKGYSAFYLCTKTMEIEELKYHIGARAHSQGFSFSQLSGINLYGPVTSTQVASWLVDSEEDVYATATLMFSNLKLTYILDTLTDISAGNNIPKPERWVTQQFMQPDEYDLDISEKLNESFDALALSEQESTGELFLKNLKLQITEARTIPHFSFPHGEGTAAIGITSFPALWIITGLGRMWKGHSFWNRFQTAGDKIGSPLLLTLMTMIEAWSIYNYLWNEPYSLYDNDWKKSILNNPLTIDGLLLSHARYP